MHTKHIRTEDTDFKPSEAEITHSIARELRDAELEDSKWERACPSPPRELIQQWEREERERIEQLNPFATRLQQRGWDRWTDKQIRDALHGHLVRRGMDCMEADWKSEGLLTAFRDIWTRQTQTVLRQVPEDREEANAWGAWIQHQERQAAAARIRKRRRDQGRNREAAKAARYRAEQARMAVTTHARTQAPRARARRSPSSRGGAIQRSAGGGGDDGDGSSDPDPEPYSNHDIFDYSRLARRWAISQRTIANLFSRNPAALPPYINLPCTRGPRWRLADVQEFEQQRRQIPDRPKRKRGRPRIAGGRQ